MTVDEYAERRNTQIQAWGGFVVAVSCQLEMLRGSYQELVGPAVDLDSLLVSSMSIVAAFSRRDRATAKEHLWKCEQILMDITGWLDDEEMMWR